MAETSTHSQVKEFYGQRIQKSGDLQTNVCCFMDRESFSSEAKEALKLLHPEVKAKMYGCGAVFPEAVEGCRILDLGSGAGVDCFVLSKLVGPTGHITGLDMTKEQLEVARRHIDYHMQQFGYEKPNVEFVEGYIEKLGEAGLQDDSFDIIISNCVVNLSPDKRAVLREAFRVLKPGGEMYFSDVYADRPVPQELKKNTVLWGECISGALEWRELMQLATEVGFAPPVLVKSTIYGSEDPELEKLRASAGGIRFCSATYRLFKPDDDSAAPSSKDPLMEVQYKGTIKGYEKGVPFSYHGPIPARCSVVMPASVANLLLESRFAPHFAIKALPVGKEAKPVCSGISDFLSVDPFEASGSAINIGSCASGSCCS